MKSNKTKKRKAAFLDRDGTINKNYGYVGKIENFKFLKKSVEAIKLLKKKKYLVIVISNQSGIARGYFSKKQVIDLHVSINKILKKKNTSIDRFYFCDYHPKFSKKKSNKLLYFRKPNPGMIFKAASDFNIDLKKSFFIGDQFSDYLTAKRSELLFIKKKYNLFSTVKKALVKINKT